MFGRGQPRQLHPALGIVLHSTLPLFNEGVIPQLLTAQLFVIEHLMATLLWINPRAPIKGAVNFAAGENDSVMAVIIKSEAFYKDVLRHPVDGDEYIQLVCEDVNGAFELRVFKGVLGDVPTVESYMCVTFADLKTAWLNHKSDAGKEGFRPALGYPIFGKVENPRAGSK